MHFFLFAGLSLVGAQTQKVPFPGGHSSDMRPPVEMAIIVDAQSGESDEVVVGGSQGTDYDYDVTIPLTGSLPSQALVTDDYDYDYAYDYDNATTVPSSHSPAFNLGALLQMALLQPSTHHHHSYSHHRSHHSHHSSKQAGLFDMMMQSRLSQLQSVSDYDYDYAYGYYDYDYASSPSSMNMLFVVPSPSQSQRSPAGLFALNVHNSAPQPQIQSSPPRMQQTFLIHSTQTPYVPPTHTQTTMVPPRTQTPMVPPRTQTIFIPQSTAPPAQRGTTSGQSTQTTSQSSQTTSQISQGATTGQSSQTTTESSQTTNPSSQTVSQAAPTPVPPATSTATETTSVAPKPQTSSVEVAAPVEVAPPAAKNPEVTPNPRANKQALPDVISYRSAP